MNIILTVLSNQWSQTAFSNSAHTTCKMVDPTWNTISGHCQDDKLKLSKNSKKMEADKDFPKLARNLKLVENLGRKSKNTRGDPSLNFILCVLKIDTNHAIILIY